MLGIASYFRVPESRAPQGSDRNAWLGNLLAVVKNRLSWPGFFVNIGLSGPFFAFAGLWAVPYLTQARGLERASASGHVSLYFVGFAIGAATWGQISDRLGRRKPAMITAAGLHAALWWLWLWDALPAGASYPLCMALGFCGAGFTLTWACAKEVNPPACSGMATSLVNVGCFLGTAVLQPLYGWVLDRSWDGTLVNGARLYHATDHDNSIRLLALVALFGCLSTFFIRETGCRNIHGELP
jgi:MFS family permease